MRRATGRRPCALRVGILAAALLLAACTGMPKKTAGPAGAASAGAATPAATAAADARKRSPYAPAQEDLRKRGDYTAGGLYAPHIADSAPDGDIDVDAIPEPDVVDEPPSKYGNRSPYSVLDKSYSVRGSAKGYDETGTASYYGNKFHGRRTSSQEVYDMYAFTAAHRTLPLPSFARVTNLDNGKHVIVRVNDRGPFHDGRLIDLSYAAAVKLGIHPRGTGRVEVTGLSPGENARQDYDAIAARGTNAATLLTATPTAAGTLALPPGVRIATGKPQAMPPSAIDALVNALPIATAAAAVRDPSAKAMPSNAAPAPTSPPLALAASTPVAATPAAAPATIAADSGLDWRFDMARDGQAMTADQFDAWMAARRARVATGKAGTPSPYGSSSPESRAARALAANQDKTKPASRPALAAGAVKPSVETLAAAEVADQPKPPLPVADTGLDVPKAAALAGGITLQVAAFGARANAERALSMLKGAGVAEVQMLDGVSAGKPVWRVRVGPVASTRVAELTSRVAGLGFGQPQVVRE